MPGARWELQAERVEAEAIEKGRPRDLKGSGERGVSRRYPDVPSDSDSPSTTFRGSTTG